MLRYSSGKGPKVGRYQLGGYKAYCGSKPSLKLLYNQL